MPDPPHLGPVDTIAIHRQQLIPRLGPCPSLALPRLASVEHLRIRTNQSLTPPHSRPTTGVPLLKLIGLLWHQSHYTAAVSLKVPAGSVPYPSLIARLSLLGRISALGELCFSSLFECLISSAIDPPCSIHPTQRERLLLFP